VRIYKVFFILSVILMLVTTLVSFARPAVAQETPTPPLAVRGPYAVGERTLTFVDDSRDHRKLVTELWYPAIAPTNPDKRLADVLAKGHRGWPNAVPDTSGEPYPLVLYSHTPMGQRTELSAHIEPLVSHGFVVAAADHPNDNFQAILVDRPLDILFVLDQLAAIKTGDLAGLIDTDHTGMMGWNGGAYTVLALTGARIDPASASQWGAKPMVPGDFTDPRSGWADWNWDKLVAYRATFSALKPGEMWPPFTDKRILGAFMFAPCLTPMFGEHGLAAATVPTLMVAGTGDMYCPYVFLIQ
jgi:predicted dienelactone hydrolase